VVLALLRNAIEHAPGGHVFVGAIRADGELRVIIIDDGPQGAEPLTGDARRSLARLLARSDASLLVDQRPGDGTTVMLCLSDVA
jgi:signal transduction histidine kinase